MPVLARTADRLHVFSAWLTRQSALATFDRNRKRARIMRFAAIFPIHYETVPFDILSDAVVHKIESVSGSARYGVTLDCRLGRNVRIACRSRDEAAKIAREIRDFLHLESKN
jgi:hypothetical protein